MAPNILHLVIKLCLYTPLSTSFFVSGKQLSNSLSHKFITKGRNATLQDENWNRKWNQISWDCRVRCQIPTQTWEVLALSLVVKPQAASWSNFSLQSMFRSCWKCRLQFYNHWNFLWALIFQSWSFYYFMSCVLA